MLVTGASSGIGRATAVGLARHGARVLLVGRNPARCEAALAAVRAAGGASAEILRADFSSLDGVRKLADDVLARTERLDVLVNNAATVVMGRSVTTDGYETQFAVNHLSYFLLTGLLLPRLRAKTPTRIVNVASDAHVSAPIDLDDLQSERRYSVFRVYGQSKSANILWTQELARRLAGAGVTANCLHPGTIRTNLGRGNGVALDLFQRAISLFMKSPDTGAETSIYLADVARRRGRVGSLLREQPGEGTGTSCNRSSGRPAALANQRGARRVQLPDRELVCRNQCVV